MENKFKIELQPETVEMIAREMESIPEKYQKPFNSTHEGYAVLLEEVREIEHVVFFGEKEAKIEAAERMKPEYPIDKQLEHEKQFVASNDPKYIHRQRLREEAVQIAAMACRIIQELT